MRIVCLHNIVFNQGTHAIVKMKGKEYMIVILHKKISIYCNDGPCLKDYHSCRCNIWPHTQHDFPEITYMLNPERAKETRWINCLSIYNEHESVNKNCLRTTHPHPHFCRNHANVSNLSLRQWDRKINNIDPMVASLFSSTLTVVTHFYQYLLQHKYWFFLILSEKQKVSAHLETKHGPWKIKKVI